MATLSKHGTEVLRTDYLTHREVIMSDGKVLRNYGQGWKIKGKVKAGMNPNEAAFEISNWQLKLLINNPFFCEYRKALHSLVKLENRSYVHNAVKRHGKDCDALFSELEDGFSKIGLTQADCKELSEAFGMLQFEAEQLRKPIVKVMDE